MNLSLFPFDNTFIEVFTSPLYAFGFFSSFSSSWSFSISFLFLFEDEEENVALVVTEVEVEVEEVEEDDDDDDDETPVETEEIGGCRFSSTIGSKVTWRYKSCVCFGADTS